MPSVAQLRAFAQVAQMGSISTAAVDLSTAQSSVSRSLRRLEQALGVALLERTSQGATLTSAGEAIIGDVRHALALIDGLADCAGHATLRGTVSVGGFRSAVEEILPEIFAQVQRQHPELSLHVQVIAEVDGGVGRAVATGMVDIGIASLPAPDGLVVVPMFEEPYVRVEPRAAAAGELPFILWHEDCSKKAISWLERGDATPAASLALDDDRAVLAHVGRGLGYSLMPRLSAAMAAGDVRVVPLDDAPVRQVGACVSSAGLRRTNVRAVFEAIKARAGRVAQPSV